MREPWAYEYDLPIAEITEVWRRGSVVASWLLDLTAQALRDDPELGEFSGNVSDSGEGRWTIAAAIDEGVPAPVLSTALYSRFASRDNDEFANRVLSAMRFGFGGHLEKTPPPPRGAAPMPSRPVPPTAPQVRGSVARRVRRLRNESWNVAQSTLAAGGAWLLASLVHSQPFFAPVAAVISLGTARGRRSRRAVELAVGVAVGIAVADSLVYLLGTSTLVLMLVVAGAMSAALLLGAGVLLVNQAAVSAIIAVATVAPGSTPSPYRALDALIGGAVALLVGQVLFPRDPVTAMARAARPVVGDLAV